MLHRYYVRFASSGGSNRQILLGVLGLDAREDPHLQACFALNGCSEVHDVDYKPVEERKAPCTEYYLALELVVIELRRAVDRQRAPNDVDEQIVHHGADVRLCAVNRSAGAPTVAVRNVRNT